MESILIVPISPFDEQLTDQLPLRLIPILKRSVTVDRGGAMDPSFAFDTARNQFNSTKILAHLLTNYGEVPDRKILGLTVADLFIPVLTFVFGEAQLSGQAAVVSTYRLDESIYGLPEDSGLLLERSVKEAVHEIGHTFGLYHCHDFECVMHSSTVAEEIDLKRTDFCPRCVQMLDQVLPGRESRQR
ncbi:MAG: archaemetzincin family Zn-dependent metalloprotease [Ignavibacteriales bacterium]|nr:archaemetzincin family Zn-dependent metalloprotease [Ignavibacteriales bacterium]